MRRVKTMRAVRRWMTLFVVTIQLQLVKSSIIKVEVGSEFCKLQNYLLECGFEKTDQEVELNTVAVGVSEVRLKSASMLRCRSPCEANLQVWTSNNVTLLGNNVVENEIYERKVNRNIEFPGASIDNVTSRENLASTSVLRDIITSIRKGTGRSLEDSAKKQNHCVGNVSVQQSNVDMMNGEFGDTSLRNSKIERLEGKFNKLTIKQSEVNNLSAVALNVSLESSKIKEMGKLVVLGALSMKGVNISEINNPGITLKCSAAVDTTINPTSDNSAGYVISNVHVEKLLMGKLNISGCHLTITNTIIDETRTEAIVVEAGGKAVINNLSIKNGKRSCLVLQGNARVILNNFTLGNWTLTHLDMSSKNLQTVYPLLAAWPVKNTVVRIRPIQQGNVSQSSEETRIEFKGMQWYWIAIMAGVGLVAGIVIGTAIMWRKPQKPTGFSSSLTLTELLARERCEEESGGNEYAIPERPDLIRQDSGLTSSSFASYTPCNERRPTGNRYPEDLLFDTPDPNLFIHVPPSLCSREEVIYEEVEALQMPKEENQYMTMKWNLRMDGMK